MSPIPTLKAELLRSLRSVRGAVETADLVAALATGLTHPRGRVWAELLALERAGVLRRSHGPPRSPGRGASPGGWPSGHSGEQPPAVSHSPCSRRRTRPGVAARPLTLSLGMAGDPTMEFLRSLDDPSLYRVTDDVPIWVPHVRRERSPDGTVREIRVTEADLPEYADRINRLVSERGVVPRVTDGHIKAGSPPPRLLGYFCRARVGRFGPRGTPAVLVRRYIKRDPECERIAAERPYRSPEVYTESKEIRGLALLLNDPFLDMGNVTYGRGELPLCYGGDQMPGDAMGATNGAMPGGAADDKPTPEEEKLFERCFKYGRMKRYFMPYQEPTAQPGQPDPTADANKPKGPVTPMEKPITPAMYEAQQARIGELTATLAGLQLERDHDRCRALLYEALPAAEFRLSDDERAKELKRLAGMPAADRPDRAQELRAIYADRKVPSGRLDLYDAGPLPTPQPGDDENDPYGEPPYHKAALAYMLSKPGTQYAAAVEHVKATAKK